MKLLSTLLILTTVACIGSKVKLVEATSQEWAGGRYESGHGTNYRIKLVAKGSSNELQVNDLWIGEDYFEVTAVRDLAKRNDLNFNKKDTVFVSAGLTLKPNAEGRYIKQLGEQKPKPRDFKGAALLGYTWKGKVRYLEITTLQKLDKIIYP